MFVCRAIITEGRESGPSGLGSSSNYVLSTLSLSSARVEHGGRYECRATNNHGSVAHAARLNVYGKGNATIYNIIFIFSKRFFSENMRDHKISLYYSYSSTLKWLAFYGKEKMFSVLTDTKELLGELALRVYSTMLQQCCVDCYVGF